MSDTSAAALPKHEQLFSSKRALFLNNPHWITPINTELLQSKSAAVLLTGFISGGFAVPLASLFDALNLMPSAVKKKLERIMESALKHS